MDRTNVTGMQSKKEEILEREKEEGILMIMGCT